MRQARDPRRKCVEPSHSSRAVSCFPKYEKFFYGTVIALAARAAVFGNQSSGIFELPSKVGRKVLIPDPLRPENLPIAATARLAQELPDDDPMALSNFLAGTDARGVQSMAMRTGTRMATGLESTRLRVAVKLAFAARHRYGSGG